MDRGENAAPYQKRAYQGERERKDDQEEIPNPEHFPGFLNHDGMEKRSSHEPGHEGRVFHRIPSPISTPAELVIGPEASHQDSRRQAAPREKGPALRDFDPLFSEPSGEKSGHGETTGNGKSDISKVEKGRMDNHRWILEERV